jgi:hypothetical protein
MLELEESLVSEEKLSSFEESLDFIFGSYELKW